MGNGLVWFSFYGNDWLRDENVRLMNLAQRGAYIDLLCLEWSEGSLPTDPELLRRLVMADKAEWETIWCSPLKERFVENESGRLYNQRLEKVRAETEAFRQKMADRGRMGAAARWSRSRDPRKLVAIRKSRSSKVKMLKHSSSNEKAMLDDGQLHIQLQRQNRVSSSEPVMESDPGSESKKDRSYASDKSDAPPRPIWWDSEKGKLDGTEDAKRDLVKRFVGDGRLTMDEFKEQIQESTYWLAERPHRRTRRSKLREFLVNWMNGAVQDKKSGAMAKKRIEAARGRVQPKPAVSPGAKWCAECHETLPAHADWCRRGKHGG